MGGVGEKRPGKRKNDVILFRVNFFFKKRKETKFRKKINSNYSKNSLKLSP